MSVTVEVVDEEPHAIPMTDQSSAALQTVEDEKSATVESKAKQNGEEEDDNGEKEKTSPLEARKAEDVDGETSHHQQQQQQPHDHNKEKKDDRDVEKGEDVTDERIEAKSRKDDDVDPKNQKKKKMDDDDVITSSSARSSRRICGSAASSSDSETADDAPLLPGEGPSQPVRLDMPGDKPLSPHDRFPKTPLKTLVAALMLVVAAASNTITLAWVHEKYPLTDPLPDLVFMLFEKRPWGLRLCENLMIGSFVSVLVLIFFHRHRWIVLRRLCFIGAVLYGMRCITMAVTQVPVADLDFREKCSPRLGENATFSQIVQRGIWSMFGLGLNLFDDQKVTLCGDYIYSGHTLVLVVSALFVGEYSPRRFYILHWLSWIVCAVGVIFLVLSHGHYTIDVLLSYFACTRVFWAYHTQVAHPSIRLSVQNHQAKEFWFPMLRWFEGDIRRPLPRRFDCPITYSQVCNVFRRVRTRGTRSGSTRPAFE